MAIISHCRELNLEYMQKKFLDLDLKCLRYYKIKKRSCEFAYKNFIMCINLKVKY